MTTTPNFLSVDLFWYMYITRLYKRDNKWLQNIYFDIPEICFLKKRYKRPRFENKIKYLISFLLGCHELTCVVLVLAPTTNVNFSIKT